MKYLDSIGTLNEIFNLTKNISEKEKCEVIRDYFSVDNSSGYIFFLECFITNNKIAKQLFNQKPHDQQYLINPLMTVEKYLGNRKYLLKKDNFRIIADYMGYENEEFGELIQVGTTVIVENILKRDSYIKRGIFSSPKKLLPEMILELYKDGKCLLKDGIQYFANQQGFLDMKLIKIENREVLVYNGTTSIHLLGM